MPTASTTTLGGVKIDGSTIKINSNGVISGSSTYTLPTASSTTLGGIKVGNNLSISNGVLSAEAGGSEVDVTDAADEGNKVATITVDGVGTDLYAPNENIILSTNL